MAKLILDTGVLLAGARGRLDESAITDTDDVALPAVVLAEYLAGVAQEADQVRQAAQRAFLDDVLALVPIVRYDREVAEHHAELLARLRQVGRTCGAHDLVVAATARATERTLVTTDEVLATAGLPDVDVRLITLSAD